MKRPIIAAIMSLATSTNLFAKEQHGAHEHGKAKLDIAIEGTKVSLGFESPAESIYGFEHEAKNPKDIAARDAAVKELKENTANLFQFQPALGCTVATATVEPWVTEDHDHAKADKKGKKEQHKKHGKHGEVHADYSFTCAKNPSGSKLTVTLTDKFPRLREIVVQFVSDKKQTGATLKTGATSIEL